MFGLTILGNNSAIPAFDRHPTSQVLNFGQDTFLIDCGEGTQIQLARYKVRRNRINHIFISHLHGDHYFGLIGLITSMSLLGREEPLHIYSPVVLEKIIEMQLNASGTVLNYELYFHPNYNEGIILEEEHFSVSCFPVKHRIECWGYIFREKKIPRKIIKEKVVEYGIPTIFYNRLQQGEDYISKDGSVVENDWVTIPNSPGKSYAYCADTIYDECLAKKVKNVNLLYHEATYLHELAERAANRFHSTAFEAGCIAQKAKVGKLVIGHFSSKYEEIDAFLDEAKTAFDNADLAIEGVTYRF
jgi:ribonuclease Z